MEAVRGDAIWLDHPRSRGVYASFGAARADDGGSSPLARGLQVVGGDNRVWERIIPARAGFTQTGVTDCSGFWDHPRSRGVYPFSRAFLMTMRGSSPLARGLREVIARQGVENRIIPARAGFTRCTS